MSTTANEQQAQYSSKPYHFTNAVGYDYMQQQQPNRASQANYPNQIAFQNNNHNGTRVQQSNLMIENGNLDVKQQYNQIENWQMNNWNNQSNNYYLQPINSHQQQHQSLIESPIQKAQQPFLNVISKPQQHQLMSPPQPNSYYSNNSLNSLYSNNNNKYLNQLNHSPLPMQSNHPNALNSTSTFNQMHSHPQAQPQQQQHNLIMTKSILNKSFEFPPDCIESVKTKL